MTKEELLAKRKYELEHRLEIITNHFNNLTEYSQEARKNMAFNETIDVITKNAIQILPYGIIVDMIILELYLTLK